MRKLPTPLFAALIFLAASPAISSAPSVPDWALPGSATHTQVPPPAGFHRDSTTYNVPIGVFEGQTDVGSALVPSSASYDPSLGTYTINSAGYNIWYTRDEFRFLWKRMKGDVSLSADISYPNPDGYGDRKAVLIFRQGLDDGSKEIMVALHGAGLIHLAQRPESGANISEDFKIKGAPVVGKPRRLGIEKKGDTFTLYASLGDEALHPVGKTGVLHLEEPFYVGVAFCSHLPDKTDTTVIGHLLLENSAGKVR